MIQCSTKRSPEQLYLDHSQNKKRYEKTLLIFPASAAEIESIPPFGNVYFLLAEIGGAAITHTGKEGHESCGMPCLFNKASKTGKRNVGFQLKA